MIRIASLFSGVAPPSLRHSIEYAAFCEIEDYPRKVLAKRYPGVPCVRDVRDFEGAAFGELDGVVGGFPCQDISGANADGKGLDGERSGLWFEMLRVIREARPRFVVAENVARLQRMGLEVVAAGLEELGYVVEATRIAASDVGAPHERMRLIIVAHRDVTGTPWPVDEFGGTWTRITGDFSGMVPRWMPDAEQGGLWPTVTVKVNHNRAGLTASSGDGLATAVAMWTTPLASDAGGRAVSFKQGGTPLSAQVRQWPTPRASDGARGAGSPEREREGRPKGEADCLPTAVSYWPTVVATDYKGSTGPGLRRGTLPEAVGVVHDAFGPLSPEWTEALMGYPIGWTDLECESPEVAPGFPMGRGREQHPWEPPRMVLPRTVSNRGKRIKCCGNGWVPGVFDVGLSRALAVCAP